MRIFLAGATGLLGRRLTRLFLEQGHEVVGLARSDNAEEQLRRLGAIPCRASIFNADALAQAAEGCEGVIHAATAIPVKTRPTSRDWALNDALRREGTRALTTCAHQIGARLYIQQSEVWVAAPPNGTWFDETTPPAPDTVSRSALNGEQIACEAGARHHFTVMVLRCGWFYGHDAPHTHLFGQSLKKRRLPIIGDGNAFWAPLMLDDAASAFATAATNPQNGVWHVVDDTPVRVVDFLHTFANLLNAPRPWRVPVWLARWVAGDYATTFFTRSIRTRNTRFREAFGWQPHFPSYREGLAHIVATWQKEGAI